MWIFSGESCTTHNNLRGVCVQFQSCASLIQLYQTSQNQQAANILVINQRSCGNRRVGRNPLLCCSDRVQQNSGSRPGQQTQPTQPPTTTTTTTTPPPPPPTQAPLQSSVDCSSPDGVNGYCIRKLELSISWKIFWLQKLERVKTWSYAVVVVVSCRCETMSISIGDLHAAKERSWICQIYPTVERQLQLCCTSNLLSKWRLTNGSNNSCNNWSASRRHSTTKCWTSSSTSSVDSVRGLWNFKSSP